MENAMHVQEEARRLVDGLPEDVSWKDLQLVIQRQRVEEGIADLDAGITWTSDEIQKSLGFRNESGLVGCCTPLTFRNP